jgi:hypothetical protein
MKTATSLPDDVFEQVEQVASAQRDAAITASYDAAFASGDDETEALRRRAARKSLAAAERDDG